MRTHAFILAAALAIARLGAATIPKTNTPPLINGRPGDAWKHAATFAFAPYNPAKPVVMATTSALTYDDRCLYIAVSCRETNLVEARQQPRHDRHDAPAWENDCVEIFLDTMRNGKSYFQFVVDIHGASADLRHFDPAWPGPALDWNGIWQHAAGSGEDGWLVQAAIPWATIGVAPGAEAPVGLNISRVRRIAPFERSVLAPTRRLHDLENFLPLSGLDISAPPLSGRLLPAPAYQGRNRMTVQLRNHTPQPVTGEVVLTVLAADGQRELRRQAVPAVLPAQAELPVTVAFDLDYAGAAQVAIDFAAADRRRHPIDAAALVFRQPMEWADSRPIATAGKTCPIRLRCFSEAPSRQLDIAILNAAGETAASRHWASLPDSSFLELPTAALPVGRYTVKAILRHGDDASESSFPLLVTPDLTAP